MRNNPGTGTGLRSIPGPAWAIAFATLVAYMGAGLVTPILPRISEHLEATPTETSYLLTSYLAVTAVAMLFTSWLSSRVGLRNTLLIGLTLISIAAIGCAFATNIETLIALRALWGLGNAFYVASALAAIVAASGGAILHSVFLYEAALGLGLALGPLVGGLLGGISWASAFWGSAALMATAFVAIIAFVKSPETRPQKLSPLEPIRAFRHQALAVLLLVAFLFSAGFWVVYAYTPFPLGLPTFQSGLVMMGLGLGMAASSLIIGPALAPRCAPMPLLLISMALFAATHVVAGLFAHNTLVLIVCVSLLGLEVGIANSCLSLLILNSAPISREVISSASSSFRFFGGAIGAPGGTALVAWGMGLPFIFAACATSLAVVLLLVFRKRLTPGASSV